MRHNGEMTEVRDAPREAGTADASTGPHEASAGSRDGSTGSRLHPRVTSFRSRSSVLTPAQQGAWDRQWPRLGRNVDDEALDTAAWFGRRAPLIIEIGSGTGTATAAMAQHEPEKDLLAIEVYRPGIAQLLGTLERENIPNVRVLRGDAVDVLENMIGPASLLGLRVFFPDPWPKSRHHKRRLLQPSAFTLFADRLVDGGVLHIATDHAQYADVIAEAGDGESALTRLPYSEPEVLRGTPVAESPMRHDRPETKFERKARDQGRAVTELLWRRNNR